MQKIEKKLSLQHKSLIPVNFKRKLAFTGSYMSKIIDASKVFTWLDYLKRNNPLYADLVYEKSEMSQEIKAYESQLLKEAAFFDDQNIDNPENNDTEEFYEESEDSSEEDEKGKEKINVTEYIKEDPVVPHDTLLIDVRETDIQEDSVTNFIAEAVVAKEQEVFFSDEESNTEDSYHSDEEDPTESDSPKKVVEDKCKVKTTLNKSERQTKLKSRNNKQKNKREKVLNVAPAEGGKIDNAARYGEAECFPELFPTGKGTYLSYVESKYIFGYQSLS